MNPFRTAVLAGVFALGATGGAHAANVVEAAQGDPRFTTLVQAIQADELAAAEEVTVFAPTNEAFGLLPGGTLENLLQEENRAQLVEVVRQHIVYKSHPLMELEAKL